MYRVEIWIDAWPSPITWWETVADGFGTQAEALEWSRALTVLFRVVED